MGKPTLVLASKSPRRQLLVKEMGFPFEVRIKEVDENYPSDIPAEQVPVYLAELKSAPLLSSLKVGEILLTSDTVVIHNNKILGKPKDKADAQHMLRALSGKSHKVVTGVCLTNNVHSVSFAETTIVHFSTLTESEINYYIENYQPFDKAGAYGIQEWIGAIGIHKIEGCYYNVMGLPVNKIYSVLKNEFGVAI